MTLSPTIQSHADNTIREAYPDRTNKGAVQDYIEAGVHTADFQLPDYLTLRAKEEKDYVYYTVFRSEGVRR